MSTETCYIQSATDDAARILRIEAVITALEIRALKAANHADIKSYKLDDSQTNIETEYRTFSDINKAIIFWEQYRQRLINKCIGRTFVLRDARNLG